MSARIRIDRMVVEGGAANGYEAQRLADHLGNELAASLKEGVPAVSRASLCVSVDAPAGLSSRRLAELVAAEIRRKLA